jgi:type I restriction enzyme S subunit
MENGIEYKIGDLCEVGRGSSPRPIIDQRYFVDGEIPWIKIADATSSGKYIYKTKEYVNEFGASFSRHLEPNSLIISASGSIGLIKFLGVKGCIHDGWLYVSNYNEEILDKEYLYYFLINYSSQFNNYSSGAAIQNINTEILRNTKIKLPSVLIQRKIAAIISNYDDLIENNKKHIKILEETTREIYNEWFVRFRFPGYENTKIIDGLPEGWEKVKIKDVFNTSSGGTPSRLKESEFYGGSIDWIKTGELKDNFILNVEEKITESGLKNSSAKLFPSKTLLMAMYGVNIGQLGISTGQATSNQAVCVFGLKDKNRKLLYYSFFFFKSLRSYLFNISMGAAQQNLSQEIINQIDFLLPQILISEKFEEIADETFEEIKILSLKNKILQESRDLLLPRLISGKLSIEHLLEQELSMVAEANTEYK